MTAIDPQTATLEGQFSRERLSDEHIRELTDGLPADAFSVAESSLDRYRADRWPLAVKRGLTGGDLPSPGLVIRPSTAGQVAEVLRRVQALEVPVTPYGAGSSVVGGAIPSDGGLVLDLGAMDEIRELDELSRIVTVEAGVRGDQLEDWLNERGFTLGHYPQSLHLSTIGGWVATRASGTFSSAYGNIEDIVDGLRVVLPTGELLDIRACPRRSAGPDLKQLFLGSEGALGVITEVDLRVRPVPDSRRFWGVTFPNIGVGIDVIRALAQADRPPAVVRLYDAAEAERLLAIAGQPPGDCLLILGWDGTEESVTAQQREASALVARHGARVLGARVGEAWFEHRFDVTALTRGTEPTGCMADTIEISMLWRDARDVYDAAIEAVAGQADRVLAHFSHVYASGTSLYVIFFIEADSDEEAEDRYLRIWSDFTEATMAAGASISHHHGVGLARVPWMGSEHGRGLEVLRDLKRVLDPAGVLNPGKLLPIG